MEIKELIIGKTYRFTHIRKGNFIAQLIDIVPTDLGDEADTQLLRCKIDTRKQTGQERLARSAKADVTVTDIRPSLISNLEEVESDTWLVERRVNEELTQEQRQQQQYEADLKKTVKTILEAEKTQRKPGFMDSLLGRKQRKH